MPEFPAPIPNRFCWVELQTTDPAAARTFYGGLFGWTFEDLPIPQGTYTVAKIRTATGDKQVGGLLPMPELVAQAGTPPSWGSYVAVEDVKASTDAAARLGAKVLLPPTALGPGTFSVLADPAGAVFLLWHTTQPMGTFAYGEPGALCWNEVISTNADVAQRFYTQLFGWKAKPMAMPGVSYIVLESGETPVAGLLQQPPHMKLPSMWTPYFAVADADAMAATATRLGGKVMVPLETVPGVGRFGWLQDPQGAVFAMIKGEPPA